MKSASFSARRCGRWLALMSLLPLGLAACDAKRLLVDPAAPPDQTVSLALAVSDAAQNSASAGTLFSGGDRLRVQVLHANTIIIDTLVPFNPSGGQAEVTLPLAIRTTPTTVRLDVELRQGRQPLMRGTGNVELNVFDRRRVKTVEVDLYPAEGRALSPISQISGGIFHSCAVDTDGQAFCWGDNLYSQLGVTGAGARLTPARVSGGTSFRQVFASYVSSCGLSTVGQAFCWGENDHGVLGNPTQTRSVSPIPVETTLRFASITMGGLHACGLLADGRAFCWGYNEHGQLGNGTTTDSRVPVAVNLPDDQHFQALSAGYLHTCGLAQDGRAYCWGYNNHGQLGTGDPANRSSPVAVSGTLTFSAVSGGGLHTCALGTDGRAHCWGYNQFGQLGDGTSVESRPTPVAVTGTPRFRSVAAGGGHTCGISQDHQAFCWGHNRSGALGTGTFADARQPAAVAGGLSLREIHAGLHHTCAVTPDNLALCWGFNQFGQLGDRSTVNGVDPGYVEAGETPDVSVSRLPVYPSALHSLLVP
jgi:alpha-tubulin suppressor-like RCC1 family protein